MLKAIPEYVIKTVDIINPLTLDNAKVLVIKKCNSIQHFLEFWRNENTQNSLKISTHCFIIVAEIYEEGVTSLQELLENFPCNQLADRPLIIQLRLKNGSRYEIFYKEIGSNVLQKFLSSNNRFTKSMITSSKLSFSLLLQILQQNIGGKFDGIDLLSCQIEISKTFDDLTIMDLAARDDDVLSARFLRIFYNSKPKTATLELAVKSSSPELLSALLDFSLSDCQENYQMPMTTGFPADKNEAENAISLAAQRDDPKMLELVLKICSYFEEVLNFQNVCNITFENEKWENLLMLLNNDAPFPLSINEIYINNSIYVGLTELRKFCDQRKMFFEAIENKRVSEIERFICENPTIKVGYNLKNQPVLIFALKIAEIEKNFDIYGLLVYHRFTVQNVDNLDSLFENFSAEEKRLVDECCQKYYGRPVRSHILYIYSRCRLGFKFNPQDEEKYFGKIFGYLDTLNKCHKLDRS